MDFSMKTVFFSRKNLNFFKIDEGGKFAVEGASYDNVSLNCLFHLVKVFSKLREFFAKNEENFYIRKNWKTYQKNYFFLEKKRFLPFKRHLQQNWREENMPVVVGRLASISACTARCHSYHS